MVKPTSRSPGAVIQNFFLSAQPRARFSTDVNRFGERLILLATRGSSPNIAAFSLRPPVEGRVRAATNVMELLRPGTLDLGGRVVARRRPADDGVGGALWHGLTLALPGHARVDRALVAIFA